MVLSGLRFGRTAHPWRSPWQRRTRYPVHLEVDVFWEVRAGETVSFTGHIIGDLPLVNDELMNFEWQHVQ